MYNLAYYYPDLLLFFWIALLIFFLAAEGLSPNFVTVWLAAGSLGGLAAEQLRLSFFWQFFSFAFVSVLSLIYLRPLFTKRFRAKTQKTNLESLLGSKALTLTPIDPLRGGTAKINGIEWSAIPAEGISEPIPPDTVVTIQSIQGVKLVLAYPENPENASES